jgi:hypothetical protein
MDREETVFDSAREINDILGASGLPLISVPLLLSTDEGILTWSEIIWLSNSLRKSRPGGTISVPGWTLLRSPEPPSHFLDRDDEIRLVTELVESAGAVIIQGKRGFGKRSLAHQYAERKGLIPQWIVVSQNGEEAEIDPEMIDLLVIADTGGPDPFSLLMEGSKGYIERIRADLPSEIHDMPLIIIREWIEEESGEPRIDLEGLPSEIFIGSCSKMGLSPDLSERLHRASKGSPAALTYLGALSDLDLERIGTSDPEDAILGVILGMGSDGDGFNPDSSQKID